VDFIVSGLVFPVGIGYNDINEKVARRLKMEGFGREAISVDVGKRLRTLREERGISIRELARRSQLSANALSMIERGMTSPSVSTLNKLATAMEVPITAFFREDPEKARVVLMRGGERPRVPFLRGLFEGLGGEAYSGRMEPFLLTLESGGSSGPFGLTHTGHEFVFCLRGKLLYEVENERYVLEAGDSLLFAAHLKHRWSNHSGTVTSAIIVISSYDEDDHPGEYHFASIGDENDFPLEDATDL